jgi:ribose transport system permease protein
MISLVRLAPEDRRRPALWRRVSPSALVLLALLIAICSISPLYRTPAGLMAFLQRASPLIVLTCGQTFVLITGGFDLSVGSLVTLVVIGSAMIANGDAALTWPAIAIAYVIGIAAGLLNGLVVARLKVPSIIATLGTLLSIKGAAMMWSGGAPSGYLPPNFRYLGRGVLRGLPGIETLPIAVIILVVFVALCGWLLHRTNFGRLVVMIGDNPNAAALAGAPVRRVRVAAFVLSALSAVTAGVLLGGFSGVSVDAGTGYELQAIAAAVVGGVVLLGGSGSIAGATIGALTLYALFTLLNLVGFPEPLRVAVQGVILIGAAALSARRHARRI